MRRLAEYRSKAPTEMRRRNVRDRGHRAYVQRIGKGTIHLVAGAQQSPVEFFGFAAHPPRLNRLGNQALDKRQG